MRYMDRKTDGQRGRFLYTPQSFVCRRYTKWRKILNLWYIYNTEKKEYHYISCTPLWPDPVGKSPLPVGYLPCFWRATC